MSFRMCLAAAAVAAAPISFAASPAVAQELALKGGIAVSRFEISGSDVFDGSITSTVLGGHYRRHFGPVAIQPELYMISRGATFAVEGNEEKVKLEYLEIPVLLVVPVRVGQLEPYGFAGPWIGLETRCRYTYEEAGLMIGEKGSFADDLDGFVDLVAHAHHRALAELLLDLAQGRGECAFLVLVHRRFLHDRRSCLV